MEIIILVFKANLPDDESIINVYFATKSEAQISLVRKTIKSEIYVINMRN